MKLPKKGGNTKDNLSLLGYLKDSEQLSIFGKYYTSVAIKII